MNTELYGSSFKPWQDGEIITPRGFRKIGDYEALGSSFRKTDYCVTDHTSSWGDDHREDAADITAVIGSIDDSE
jgi:hypothetical protein